MNRGEAEILGLRVTVDECREGVLGGGLSFLGKLGEFFFLSFRGKRLLLHSSVKDNLFALART